MLLDHPASLKAEGVSVLTFGSSDFTKEIVNLLTVDQAAKAASFLPYSIVVINNTPRPIYSFTVIFTFLGSFSESGKAWRHIVSPTAPSMDRLSEPGSRTLVTPVSDFLATADASGKNVYRPYIDPELENMIRDFAEEHKQSKIRASIDSVVFGDGTLIGPDVSGRLDELNERLKADDDLFNEIRGLKGAPLRDHLKALSESAQDPTQTYAWRKMAMAKHCLYVLDKEGELKLREQGTSTKWLGGESRRVRRKEQ
jgi:hypothetical protein